MNDPILDPRLPAYLAGDLFLCLIGIVVLVSGIRNTRAIMFFAGFGLVALSSALFMEILFYLERSL